MNSNLSGQLLSKVMGWSDEELANELPWLQFMAGMKYDSYDQFMPGNRFLASLVQWMTQFDSVEERQLVYDFLKKNLIFISSTQITYLIKLLNTTKIRQDLIKRVADELKIPSYLVRRIEETEEFKSSFHCSMIVGLSDGAHIDVLRRAAGLSNDQVLTNYYPDEDKANDMLNVLQKIESVNAKFTTLYLIDDFTASGTSFIRKEENAYKGKLCKVLDQFADNGSPMYKLFDSKKMIYIRVFFCVATEYALAYLREAINAYVAEKGIASRFKIEIDSVQIINDDISRQIKENNGLHVLVQKYFKDSEEIMTKSYRKGKCDQPYWGYNEGALPIVLSHNTPNNSLPILWQNTTYFKGLFPRVNRHIQ